MAPRDTHRPSLPWSYPHFPPPRSGSWRCICTELSSPRTDPPKVWPLFPLLFSYSFVSWIQTRGRVKARKWSWILHGAHSFPMMFLLPTRKPTPKRKQRLSPSSTKQPWAFHMHTGDSLYPTGCAVILIAHDLILIETHPSLYRAKWTWEEQSNSAPFSSPYLWGGRGVHAGELQWIR